MIEPLRKRDREKTSFACELGLFQWKRMPFGLCNSDNTIMLINSDNTEGKETWLCFASEHRLSECGELEKL